MDFLTDSSRFSPSYPTHPKPGVHIADAKAELSIYLHTIILLPFYWHDLSKVRGTIGTHLFHNMPIVAYILLRDSPDIHHNLISLENDGDEGLT